MNTNERLIISTKGLKDGWHKYKFKISNEFFKSLEYSELEDGNLTLNINLNKSIFHLLFEYQINGFLNVVCDRCLENFDIKFNTNGTFSVQFTNVKEENDEGLISVLPKSEDIDISHYIYESLILGLPSQRIHPLNEKGESSCNKEMLRRLNKINKNLSKENYIDSRWEKLKNIIN